MPLFRGLPCEGLLLFGGEVVLGGDCCCGVDLPLFAYFLEVFFWVL